MGQGSRTASFCCCANSLFLPKSFALAVESINLFSLQRPDPGPRPPPRRSTDAARRSAPNVTWNPKYPRFSLFMPFFSRPGPRGTKGTGRTPTHTQTTTQTCINLNETQRHTAGERRRWICMPSMNSCKTLQIIEWQSVVTESVFH